MTKAVFSWHAANEWRGFFSPHLAECLAAQKGVLLANTLGFRNWIFKSDAMNVVRAVPSLAPHAWEAPIIGDILDVMNYAYSVPMFLGTLIKAYIFH
ncbi:hypothetical protein TIFTF001_029204 [Ficus carica]|uniref:RNase H type-1 domain-containing protein n=1 Tax=Ficus carica TaxID=3494 RepID=A0AA88J2J6_FICCA|nr:hypothetical protein TIFTF001_029204 [Ficus carica]